MVIYNIKSKHFTLAYDDIDKHWIAIRSGTARGLKINLYVEVEGDFPVGSFVSLNECLLGDRKGMEMFVEVLQDAIDFGDMIRDAENIKPI